MPFQQAQEEPYTLAMIMKEITGTVINWESRLRWGILLKLPIHPSVQINAELPIVLQICISSITGPRASAAEAGARFFPRLRPALVPFSMNFV